jgi:lysophospholipid acyltransferase (LPLAT)-like uncharacterized protein
MSAAKEIKYFLINNIFTSIIFALVYIYAKTLRVQLEGHENVQKHLENGGRIIFSGWHQRLFGGFFIPPLFKWSPCIMISQSRDGDFISKIVQHTGWIPVRGSSSRGGMKALRTMVKKVTENHIGAHIVDGPTGPPRVIKPGLISLAHNSHAAICPGIVSYSNAWIFNSWDHFMVPKPFSRVLFRFGAIFTVPETINDDQFESLRKKIEDEMIKAYKAADESWNRKN